MITGFEKETEPLNEEETRLAHMVAICLESRLGEELALKNGQLSDLVGQFYGVNIPEGKMRKIINHIRRHQLVKNLLASSKGYWVARDRDEVLRYVRSLYERISAIKKVAESYEVDINQTELWRD